MVSSKWRGYFRVVVTACHATTISHEQAMLANSVEGCITSAVERWLAGRCSVVRFKADDTLLHAMS